MIRRLQALPLILAVVIVLAACGSADEPAATGTDTTIGETATPSAPPTGQLLVEGLPKIDVLSPPEANAGDAPLFSWQPVDGATRYFVSVLGPDGPLWGWQGEEPQIYFGGLPFERPPGWAGPDLVAGSCWSVFARGGDGHVIAVSELLPVSPQESPGQACVPGSGSGVG